MRWNIRPYTVHGNIVWKVDESCVFVDFPVHTMLKVFPGYYIGELDKRKMLTMITRMNERRPTAAVACG